MANATVSVRPAVDADAGAIAAVHVRSWQSAYRGIVSDAVLDALSIADRERRWHGWIATATVVLVAVADDGGAVVGFCSGSNCEIGALYVDPARWRAGIGSALLAPAIAALAHAGADAITLWVYEANERARAFYARQGFAPDGAIQADEGGAVELRMRRPAGML